MRTTTVLLALAPVIFYGASLAAVSAQQRGEPRTWKQKKAAILKPITVEQQNLIRGAIPKKISVEPMRDRRMLVFYRCEGFVHKSITAGNVALVELGKKTGAYSADLADEYSVFNPENLQKYDAVLFNNTTNLRFDSPTHKGALMDFVKSGNGIIGIHAASDNFYTWPEARNMIGGQFDGHPWTAGGTWAFKLDDPGHPVNRAFGKSGFWHQDEIYQYKPDSFAGYFKLRVLVSLDMNQSTNTDILRRQTSRRYYQVYSDGKRQVPVSWIRKFEGGRVFYTNFGHRSESFWNPVMLRHYLDGIQFALGDLNADTTPTAESSPKQPARAPSRPQLK